MIENEAVVIRVEQQHAWVKIRPHTPCGSCDPETGCKTVAMTRLFRGDKQDFCVSNPLDAQPGDLVRVAVADGVLLKSAMLGYGLPLVGLLVGAAIGQLAYAQVLGDFSALLGAVLGCAAAMLFLKTGRKNLMAEPVIVFRQEPGLPMLSSCKNKSTIR